MIVHTRCGGLDFLERHGPIREGSLIWYVRQVGSPHEPDRYLSRKPLHFITYGDPITLAPKASFDGETELDLKSTDGPRWYPSSDLSRSSFASCESGIGRLQSK